MVLRKLPQVNTWWGRNGRTRESIRGEVGRSWRSRPEIGGWGVLSLGLGSTWGWGQHLGMPLYLWRKMKHPRTASGVRTSRTPITMPVMAPTSRARAFSCPESRRERERGNGVRVHWREYQEESHRERAWLGGRRRSEACVLACLVITMSSWLSHCTRLHHFPLHQIWNLGLAPTLHSLTVAISMSCSFSFEGLFSSPIMPPPSDFLFPSPLSVLEGSSSPVHPTLISSNNINELFPGTPVRLAQWEILYTHFFWSFHPHEGGVVIPAVHSQIWDTQFFNKGMEATELGPGDTEM